MVNRLESNQTYLEQIGTEIDQDPSQAFASG